ncbi:MAG: 16S rRNA (uracil(1498)-N(3))-methyltransferase [Clostridia bacterium]|nr:16S rRNA (uracil(1498)-N(3))-methyltransferase [Clostridia bacterium]
MYNFFVKEGDITENTVVITGADYNHIKKVLRLREGDTVLVSVGGYSHLCELKKFESEAVILEIIERNSKDASLPIDIYLYQGKPKSDKMELIIQKAVELGVNKIVPVSMKRSIVKLDDKKAKEKVSRWQAISESASKQSKRNVIPEVLPVTTLKNAINELKSFDSIIVPYENKEGMLPTLDALKEMKSGPKVGVVIGPEGGFEDEEIKLLQDAGAKIVSLGKRILRTETAAITTLSMLMLYAEIKL